MQSERIIRLFLWEVDGSSAGEYIPAPGKPRPREIVIDAHVYLQDPRDADRYLRE